MLDGAKSSGAAKKAKKGAKKGKKGKKGGGEKEMTDSAADEGDSV